LASCRCPVAGGCLLVCLHSPVRSFSARHLVQRRHVPSRLARSRCGQSPLPNVPEGECSGCPRGLTGCRKDSFASRFRTGLVCRARGGLPRWPAGAGHRPVGGSPLGKDTESVARFTSPQRAGKAMLPARIAEHVFDENGVEHLTTGRSGTVQSRKAHLPCLWMFSLSAAAKLQRKKLPKENEAITSWNRRRERARRSRAR
jgi:hypothetical protein